MTVEVKVPSVGESITEGSIARWLKKDGDFVKNDEPLFELETDKASQEIPAPAAGVLRIQTAEGKDVAIGDVVALIEPGSATSVSAPAKDKTSAKPQAGDAKPQAGDGKAEDTPALSPAARRLAAEEGVKVEEIAGTGKHGMILKSDVQVHLEKKEAAPSPVAPEGEYTGHETETRQRMSAIRQRIAVRLLASQKATASLTTFNDADMSALVDLRTRFKDKFKEKHGVGLGFMSFFVKACCDALRAFPLVNSRIEDADIVTPNYYHIGVAVSTDKGLLVPVLRDADRMSFAEIEKAIAELAGKARDGKISVHDLTGGTFTITNGGVFGSMLSTPILNPPQCAILGMHAIQKRPVVRDDQIVIRPMMYLALTYDHRLIDGREAVLFLAHIKETLENPGRLLLDV
ncbi:MAG: 2-oxoglutarate dehydrogenase complex dihydrolipoyllysine-residue succinyltransferase [Gemmataceae bacterium]|nr:2-oxoglutarate dehydrogenase complex dihydrolipoyllysine-residue succinyltransferase [Gemmataceae bacterium]MCI0740690.1 2-oxoglutarate dehydrogenase complex dihydrolipoyllysine-residue succinyltransferase [Gemmataceae bacterium]